MKEIEKAVAQITAQVCGDNGLELLELKFIPRKNSSLLRITIDSMSDSVKLKDCEAVSRQISRLLDVEDPIPGSYQLEVSSPGFKRLLRIPKDLPRFIGHRVRIKLQEPLQGKSVWIGILDSPDDPIKLGQTEIGQILIPFRLVKQANLNE